ncbi:(2,3-dihydroxybenzoyl)adenylate synthase [Lysinibacillus sp. NPDC096418]|uniref:(2,3-dihydroxybenzoyl)adenylate synthase n=1 Tax=Lysinibacillus sp. NPDC096418 TaxID=3364138 RepID=UPI00381F4E3C
MLQGCKPWPEEFVKMYQDHDCWRGETFGRMLSERANLYGDRIAITNSDISITYKELDDNVNCLANGFLKMGIKKNDRVVVQLPNITEFFDICFALFRIGALPVFSLPLHRSSEITYFCEFTEASAYIIPDYHAGFDYRALAREVQSKVPNLKSIIVVGESEEFVSIYDLYKESTKAFFPEVRPNDIAFLQLSGGSTGLSKLIPRTHDDYIYSLRRSAEICLLNQDSTYLAVLPIAHNFPMSSPGVFGTLYAGGKVVLTSGASPDEAFPLIEKERVTITALVPPLALIWLDSKATRSFDLSSLEVLQVGGAKFSAEAAKRVRPTFNCTLQQVFGMAEGLVNYTKLDDSEENIVHTQGKPMSPFDEIRIVDENDFDIATGEVGHLLTRGPYTIRGYYNANDHNKKAFTSDGFYRTGDLVRMTESGYIIVEGREKDQINRGGEKIAAEEVENHLLSHHAVHDATLVSMPDEFLGERSCAFIIKRDNEITSAELKKYLKEKGLALYKIPDRIEFVDCFPKTTLGKVNKKALRELILEKVKTRIKNN